MKHNRKDSEAAPKTPAIAGTRRSRAPEPRRDEPREVAGGSARASSSDEPSAPKPKVLFICGSLNQTTQMHAIARELPEVEAWFTPYYVDGVMETVRKLGGLNMSIAGNPWASKCFAYLEEHGLPIDYQGKRHAREYQLVFHCQDAVFPRNIRDKKVVLVQEGMTDPEGLAYRLVKRFEFLPRWLASTAPTGLSDMYVRFCVASEGYRDLFIRKGCRPEKLVVTGIPNFDDMEQYTRNDIPHRDYVLICTSDTRETFKFENRYAFLRRCRARFAGRQMIFKLHPNENHVRNTREILEVIPDAIVYTSGSAEQLVANCATLVVEYSTLAFVGLALGKEVYANYDLDELRRLLPIQNKRGAKNIANVGRELLGLALRREEPRDGPREAAPAPVAGLVNDVQSRAPGSGARISHSAA